MRCFPIRHQVLLTLVEKNLIKLTKQPIRGFHQKRCPEHSILINMLGHLVCWLLSFYLSIVLHKKTLPQISLHLRGNFLTSVSTIAGKIFLRKEIQEFSICSFLESLTTIDVQILFLPFGQWYFKSTNWDGETASSQLVVSNAHLLLSVLYQDGS